MEAKFNLWMRMYQDLFPNMENNDNFADFVQEQIARNKDNTVKGVGDKIIIWDTSRLTYAESNKPCSDPIEHSIVNCYESIVIEASVRYNANITIGEKSYEKNLDLIVWNKTLNKKFRTSSDFVKLFSLKSKQFA